jgi:hypothetical protein
MKKPEIAVESHSRLFHAWVGLKGLRLPVFNSDAGREKLERPYSE